MVPQELLVFFLKKSKKAGIKRMMPAAVGEDVDRYQCLSTGECET
jgi:hypothetical protein